MDKAMATFRLGGTPELAARWIGISPDVFRLWPERLHPVMVDRVYAAIMRRHAAAAMGIGAREFFADPRNETFTQAMADSMSEAAATVVRLELVPAEFNALPEHARKKRGPRKASEQEPSATTQ